MNWLPTGVPGLDLVLNDGVRGGAVVVVAGPPGSGKTILAQQMCFATATGGRKCTYYTTVSEPHTKLVRHLESFSFFDPAALGPRVEYIHLGDFLRPERQDGLGQMTSEIIRKVLDEKPALVVIDSAKMLSDFADERDLRTALYDLTSRIAQSDTVLLLLGEYTAEELQGGVEFSLADGIIQLEHEPREPVEPAVAAGGEAARRKPSSRQAHVPDRPQWHRGVPPGGDAHPGAGRAAVRRPGPQRDPGPG